MDDDADVTPIGARMGSQRLYEAPDAPDDYQPPTPAATPAPRVRPAPSPSSTPPAVAARGPTATAVGSAVLELAGISVLTVGCYLIAPAVGLIVAGVCLMVLGIAVSR